MFVHSFTGILFKQSIVYVKHNNKCSSRITVYNQDLVNVDTFPDIRTCFPSTQMLKLKSTILSPYSLECSI